eukprot:6486304-Amphidinium_carterae.1
MLSRAEPRQSFRLELHPRACCANILYMLSFLIHQMRQALRHNFRYTQSALPSIAAQILADDLHVFWARIGVKSVLECLITSVGM